MILKAVDSLRETEKGRVGRGRGSDKMAISNHWAGVEIEKLLVNAKKVNGDGPTARRMDQQVCSVYSILSHTKILLAAVPYGRTSLSA